MEDTPTMPQLQLLNIPTHKDGEGLRIIHGIGTTYLDFGTMILNDDLSSRVKSLEHQFQRDCNAINWNILQAWVSGEGRKPVTWKTLVTVLKEIQLEVLARKIEICIAGPFSTTSGNEPGNGDKSLTATEPPPNTTASNESTTLVSPHSTTVSFNSHSSSSVFTCASLVIAFLVLLVAALVAMLFWK